jgi:hypothetical protein
MSEGDTMKVVVLDVKGLFECHKAECQDVAKKLQVKDPRVNNYVQNHWFENSIEEAEVEFNDFMNEDEPDAWFWKRDVQVYPCVKG